MNDHNVTLTKAREKRAMAAEAMEKLAVLDKLTDEQRAKWKEHEQDQADAVDQIDRLERSLKVGPHSPKSGDDLGLTTSEKRRYSFQKVVRAMAMRLEDPKALNAIGFEMECSRAIAKNTQRDAMGIYIPREVWSDDAEKRALNVATGDAGGFLVQDDLRDDLFIGMIRNKSALAGSGAMLLGGLVGDVLIPKQAGAAQFYWLGTEDADVSESQQTISQVRLTPRHGAAHTRYSKQTLLQSSLSIENFIRNDLTRIAGLGIDLAAFNGTGVGGQPLGLKNTSGVNKPTAFAGANPTWNEVLALVSSVADDGTVSDFGGAEDGREMLGQRFILRGNMAAALMGVSKDAGSGQFVLQFEGQQARIGLWGVTVSNQITDGDLWFGDWSQAMIGTWGDPDLIVNPYTGDTSGVVRLTLHQFVDVAPRHPTAFGWNT